MEIQMTRFSLYAYPSKQHPDQPKKKFVGLSKSEVEVKYKELIEEGYTNITIVQKK
jgi:hypothetical protein